MWRSDPRSAPRSSGAPYRPTDAERTALALALDDAQHDPTSLQDWADVRSHLRTRR